MSELKIDEKHLRNLCIGVKKLIIDLYKEMQVLEDKDADIFSRYMSYSRVSVLFQHICEVRQLIINSFRFGFDLNQTSFRTDLFINEGWGKSDLTINPFFINEESSGILNEGTINSDDLPIELQEQLKEIIMKKIKGDCINEH